MVQVLFSQVNITGIVYDANSKPLGGVSIRSDDSRLVYTNQNGEFLFPNVNQQSYLKFEVPGFSRQDVYITEDSGDDLLEIYLDISSRTLEEVACISISSLPQATNSNLVDKSTLNSKNFGQDLPFLLENLTSVVCTSDAGAGIGYTGIRVRGLDPSRINVTINGIPVNDPESHDVYWVNMPDLSSSIQSIDFQRGVNTTTNGAAAFGAALHIKTNNVTDAPTGKIDASYGSFGSYKTSITATTGLIKNKYFLETRLSKIGSQGFIDRASSDLTSWYLNASYLGKKSFIKALAFSGKEITYQSWYGTPESVLFGTIADQNAYADRNGLSIEERENLLNSGRTYNYYTYSNQVDHYQQDNFQLHFNHRFSDNLVMNAAAHYTYGRGYYEEYRKNDELAKYHISPVIVGNDTINSSDLIRRRWLDNDFIGGIYSLQYFSKRSFNIILGGVVNNYLGRHFGEVIWARYASDSELGDKYYNENGQKLEWSNYCKAQYSVGRFRMYGDLQYRYLKYSFVGLDFVSGELKDVTQSIEYKLLNPKLALIYEINSSQNLYSSFGISNREPVRRDFRESTPTSRPKPEHVNDFELGYSYNRRKLKARVNFYLMDFTNQLVLTGQINDVGAYTRTNVKDSYRRGVELEANATLFKNLELKGNLTLSQNIALNYEDFVDEYLDSVPYYNQVIITYPKTNLAMSPNVIAAIGATYILKNTGLKFDWNTKWVGQQFLDNTQSDAKVISAYTHSSLGIRFAIRTTDKVLIECSGVVNNLFNAMYQNNGYSYGYIYGGVKTTENFYYPQAGRNYMFRISVGF